MGEGRPIIAPRKLRKPLVLCSDLGIINTSMDRVDLLDLTQIFSSIGEISAKSISEFCAERADRDDWLIGPQIIQISDPNQLPDGYYNELALLETVGRRQVRRLAN